ncbi:MAG: hypothetical protein ACTSVA_08515 [Candidatus Njordarchaeales archaeon]
MILEGKINLPNPCYRITASAEVSRDELNIMIGIVSSEKICIQCLAIGEFKIRVSELPESIKKINILYRGRVLYKEKTV